MRMPSWFQVCLQGLMGGCTLEMGLSPEKWARGQVENLVELLEVGIGHGHFQSLRLYRCFFWQDGHNFGHRGRGVRRERIEGLSEALDLIRVELWGRPCIWRGLRKETSWLAASSSCIQGLQLPCHVAFQADNTCREQ